MRRPNCETEYAREIWNLYEAGKLIPASPFSGGLLRDESTPDLNAVPRYPLRMTAGHTQWDDASR